MTSAKGLTRSLQISLILLKPASRSLLRYCSAFFAYGTSPEPPEAPANEYGIFPNLYNLNDATFTFLENVLTQVMQLFPSPYIHVGGDEAIKNQWETSPAIQAKMKELGLPNEDALQSYFTKRIDTFLTAHGRRTVGWDEILQGGLAPNAVVMSWHGIQGGIEAAKLGHDAVLTPVRPLYFNYRQSTAADEAPGRFALNTLESVYDFNPEPASLTSEQRRHILGVQANLWTEYVITSDHVDWMLYPLPHWPNSPGAPRPTVTGTAFFRVLWTRCGATKPSASISIRRLSASAPKKRSRLI